MVRWRRGAWGLQDYYKYTLYLNKTCVKAPWEEEVFFCTQLYYTVRWTRRAGGRERGELEKEWADWEEEEEEEEEKKKEEKEEEKEEQSRHSSS
jgi:hypothetical protein